MDFRTLPRRDLQTLCKKNKIAANMTNIAMADALRALPAVEGLEALRHEHGSLQYRSPKTEPTAASPAPPSHSCRRTSTRKQISRRGSTRPRIREGGIKNEDVVEKGQEEEAEAVPAVGIPNSPTTLDTRGRRTRTLVIVGGLEADDGEEDAEKKAGAVAESLLVPITPGTRTTGGRRRKPWGEEAEEGAENKPEARPSADPRTPVIPAVGRASTEKDAARVAGAISTARSTRYRTRRTALEEAVQGAAAAPISTADPSRKICKKRGKVAEEIAAAGEEDAGDERAASEGGATEVPWVLETVNQTDESTPIDVDLTAREEGNPSIVDRDETPVDQTVQEAPPDTMGMESRGVAEVIPLLDRDDAEDGKITAPEFEEETRTEVSPAEIEKPDASVLRPKVSDARTGESSPAAGFFQIAVGPGEEEEEEEDGGSDPVEKKKNDTFMEEHEEEGDGNNYLVEEEQNAFVEEEEEEEEDGGSDPVEKKKNDTFMEEHEEEGDGNNYLVEEEQNAFVEEEEEEEEAPVFVAVDDPAAHAHENEKAETAIPDYSAYLPAPVEYQDKEKAALQQLQGRQPMAAAEYDGSTSLRKLKAALKEKLQQQRVMEERKKQKRRAAAGLETVDAMSLTLSLPNSGGAAAG